MTTLSTFLLSIIQSATEFLPVSSSGHLILAEKFGFSNQTLLTDISLHLGTLFAVCAFFFKDIYRLLVGFWHKGTEQKLGCELIVATVPAVIVGFFLADIVETTLRSPIIIAYTSIFYGILLWVIDKKAPREKTITQMTYKNALFIGIAQSLALIPGTSRSGITMTCARFLGYSRTESARFSMLMSIPIIFFGAIYMLFKSFQENTLSTELLSQIGLGIITSAVFGLIAVWFLMRWLKTASFALFACYRVILGIVLLFLFWN